MTMEQFTCNDIQAVLSGFVDGELDSSTRHRVEVHLAQCDGCRALIDEAEELDAQVRATVEAREHWSDDLERRIFAAVNDPLAELRAMRRLRLSAWTGWITSIAAILFVALLLAVQFRSGSGTADSSPDASQGNLAGSNPSEYDSTAVDGNRNDIAIGVLPPNENNQLSADASSASDAKSEDPNSNASESETVPDLNDPNRYASTDETNASDADDQGDSLPVIDVVGDYETVGSSLAAFALPGGVADAGLEDEPSTIGTPDRPRNPVREVEDEVAPSPDPAPNLVASNDAASNEAIRNASPAVGDDDESIPANVMALNQGSNDVGSSESNSESSSASPAAPAYDDDWRFQTDDVLYSSSVLIRLLEHAKVNSFEDVRQINQVLEFDDLLDMLAASRDQMNGDEAEVVDRAWAALEWVNGPMDQQHLRRVQQMINDERLADRLEALSNKYASY